MGKNTFRGFYMLLLLSVFGVEIGFSQCPTVVESTQSFCDTQDATISDLSAVDNGGGVQWYASPTSSAPLIGANSLQDGVTYYVDDTTGSCGTRGAVTVEIYGPPEVVNFQGFCITSSVDPIPTLADVYVDGVNVQWYDAAVGGTALPMSTTLVNNTVYYATQSPDGSCESTSVGVLVYFVDVALVPVGNTEQYFCEDSSNPPTIGDLVVSGDSNWYETETSTTPLAETTVLVDGETYYSTNVAPPCESDERLPVTVTIYPQNEAGEGADVIICEADIAGTGTVDLFAELTGTPESGGTWSGPLPVTGGVVDITSMTAGDTFDFTYSVSNSVNCPTDTSVVSIIIPGNPNSGIDNSVSLCSYDTPINLWDLLGGSPMTGGVWSPTLTSGTGVFDPAVDAPGVYTYTVTSPGSCSQSSSGVSVDVVYDVSSGSYTGSQDLCAVSGDVDLFDFLDGSEDAGGVWSDNGGNAVTNPIDVSSFSNGNYTYTYTVTNACFSSATDITFEISVPITSGVFTTTAEVCVLDGTFDLFTLLDGSQDMTGSWEDSSGNPVSNVIDISTFATGIYDYEYSVENVCGTSSTTVSVSVFNPPNAGTFTGAVVNCSTTGQFDLSTLLDGTQDTGGTWLDSTNTPIVNPIDVANYAAGSYTYTYSVTNVCGNDTEDVTIVFPEDPDAGTNSTFDICITSASADLFTLLGGTPDSGGVWSPALSSGTNIFDPSVDTSGTYTYTVTSSGGCLQSSASVVVTVHDVPHSGVYTGSVDICNNTGNFDLFTLLDGSEDAGGQWYDSSNNAVANAVALASLSIGNHTYTYSVTNFCNTVSTDVTFNVQESITAGVFGGVQNVCVTAGTFDLFDLLDGSQAAGGQWTDASNNVISNIVDISSFVDGVYSYTYSVSNSCGSDDTAVSLAVFTAPSSGVFTGIQENCTTAGVYDLFDLLDGTQDTGGTWYDSSNTAVNSNVDVSGYSSGTYDFIYEVTNVCGTESTTVTLMFPDTPDAGTDGTVAFCPADTGADLFNSLGGSPETGGVWSPALASGTGFYDPTVDAPGVYTYTVTTSGGCLQNSATVTVSILPLANSGTATGIQQACANNGTFDLFTLLDGTQDAGGTWYNIDGVAVTNPLNILSLVEASYTYTYTVSSACDTSSTDVTVEIFNNPSSGTFTGSQLVCPSDITFDLYALLDGSEEDYGTWIDGANNVVTNPIDVSLLTSGTYEYTYSVLNVCGTSATQVSFEVPNLPDAGLDSTFNICPNSPPVDLLVNLGGTPETGGVWSPALASGTNTFDPSVDAEGIYTYTVSSAGNCFQASAQMEVIFDPLPNSGVFAGPLDVCPSAVTFDLETLLDGSQDAGGTWTVASTTSVVSNPLDVSGFTSGTYSYDYTVSNICADSVTTVNFVVPDLPDAGGNSAVEFCITGASDDLFNYLAGTPETGGTWSPALASGTGVFDPSVDAAGVYTYTVTSAGGCFQNSAEVLVNVSSEVPHAGIFTGIEDVCINSGTFDLMTLLSGSSTNAGTWVETSTGNIITNPLDVSSFSTGVYTYTYQILNSCGVSEQDVQINVLGDIQFDNSSIAIQSPVCYEGDAEVTLTNTNMIDGVYDIYYTLSGANNQPSQSIPVTMTGGSGTFYLPGTTDLINEGTTTITIDAVDFVSINGCNFTVVGVSADIEVVPLIDISSNQLSADNICFGEDVIVLLSGTNLVDGTYEIEYLLETTGSTATYTVTVVVAGGDATIIIPAANVPIEDDAYLFEITAITNLDLGCANLNENAATIFDVYPSSGINYLATKLEAEDTCINSEGYITIINNTVADGNYEVSYDLSGATIYSATNVSVTFVNGSALLTIPEGILTSGGTVTFSITSMIVDDLLCPVTFTDIFQVDFEVIQGEAPVLMDEGNIFCSQDFPVIRVSDLNNNLEAPVDNVLWYTTIDGTTPLDNDAVLTENQTVYGVYVMYAICSAVERLQVTIEVDFCDIIIPDGFSPNNDGVNETFDIKDLRLYYPDFKIEIFNRYGNILYRGDYNTPNWSGNATEGGVIIGDNKVPAGVYFFILELHDEENRVIQGRLYLNR
ncbi:gliding motility-associated C-terminal domain-containing protein [Neptunitalea lumnitzerae]|uniref:Gliding motility-associated C-terminal domain-containing protein n=1 Tax=Neptunitalea lumnitzerae TaxID=2965509 RepID=A0ABQ5ML58_9FLAO|nr:gliding motility-associated C-terminal domain-containing protein [Neptunitalea sp. Y10]GLB50119.1 hypothetical protein Y10_24870 [Neptunitalea sp. Y10]